MKKLLLTFLILLFSLTSNVVWSNEYKTNPGFRDLRPGITASEYFTHCSGKVCYGIENIKFSPMTEIFNKDYTLDTILLDMGPIVASDGSFFSQLNNLVVSSNDEPNIYVKMKKNFDSKYALDYEYSERDRQLFNEGMRDDLLGVYSNGQVVLRINLKENENSYSKKIWLYIEYRGVKNGKQFLDKYRPIKSTLDDF